MRSARFGLPFFLLLLSISAWAQQAPSTPPPNSTTTRPGQLSPPPPPVIRDAQALVVLQKAVSAISNMLPADSVATGSVTVLAGTKTDQGSMRILTRGVDQSSEEIQLPDQTNSVIYSRGQANEVVKGTVKTATTQLAASSQSASFPLPFLAAALADPDLAIQYIGDETIESLPVHHVRLWKTYASKPTFQRVWESTIKELWVDAATGLPRKLAYERREGGSAKPHIRMEVFYSDWRNANGVFYPYQIEKSLNGTPWITITIQSVAFQTGLSDSDFPITLPKAVKP